MNTAGTQASWTLTTPVGMIKGKLNAAWLLSLYIDPDLDYEPLRSPQLDNPGRGTRHTGVINRPSLQRAAITRSNRPG